MSPALAIEAAPLRDHSAPLLELRGICKAFPGVRVLDEVSFAVWPGEVHMLLGENGAGKSSLMKVLCGAYHADAGEFFHHGEKVAITSSADAKRSSNWRCVAASLWKRGRSWRRRCRARCTRWRQLSSVTPSIAAVSAWL